MDSPTQLATQIRFHLEALGETNAHHPFEQLCPGLTRRRIVSNVIPAAGPVSAGGDGGRDAESFWSVLAKELPDTSLFTALATPDAVVLAVTAQRADVTSKIRSDLSKIRGKGEPVDRVLYFTVAALETARRHDLQEHARAAPVLLARSSRRSPVTAGADLLTAPHTPSEPALATC